MPEQIQDVLLTLAFQACGGHHSYEVAIIAVLCNEYLSLPKKKKKKKVISSDCHKLKASNFRSNQV